MYLSGDFKLMLTRWHSEAASEKTATFMHQFDNHLSLCCSYMIVKVNDSLTGRPRLHFDFQTAGGNDGEHEIQFTVH